MSTDPTPAFATPSSDAGSSAYIPDPQTRDADASNELARSGLTSAEVNDRVERGEINRMPDDTSRSLWSILRSNVFTLFNGIVFTSFLLLLLVGEWKDALFGFSAVANAIIGVAQEYRAKKSLDELALLNAPRAVVVRDGERSEIDREDVVLGDVIALQAGDQVPADAEVLSGTGLALDEAMLTGESDPVEKDAGMPVLAGSSVISGHGLAQVTKVGPETFAAKLTVEAKRFSLVDSEIRTGLNRILRWIALMLAPVLLIVVNGQMQTVGGWEEALTTGRWREASVGAIAAAIAMVPLGLVLMTSVAFAVGAVKLSRQQVLVQELPAVEGLARVDVICFDKTGTLTDGTIGFDAIDTRGEDEPEGLRHALAAMSADENANASAKALADACEEVSAPEPTRQIVFNSARKWSAMSFATGPARGTWVLGAPDIVIGDASKRDRRFVKAAREAANAGSRALMLAFTPHELTEAEANAEELPPALDAVAVITLQEHIRDDAADTVRYFREQGVDMRVISGDDPRTVSKVAEDVGIAEGDGFDARNLPEDEDELARVMDEHRVFGRVTPEQKRSMVKALKARDHVVAMTGDGVNDVLALKDADLGIAMGNGAPATRAVSRIVLLDGKFSHLPHVVREGRQVIANVERVSMLFLSKTAYSLFIAVLFGALLWGFPFLPRQLSALDGLTIGLPGFILALIPNPRRYVPGFMSRALWFALPSGAIVTTAILAINVLSRSWGVDADTMRTASCITLGIIALWVLNVLARPLNWWRWMLLGACYLGMVAVMTLPYVSDFFAFQVPEGPLLWWALGIGLAGMIAIEIHFRIHRHHHAAGHESHRDRARFEAATAAEAQAQPHAKKAA